MTKIIICLFLLLALLDCRNEKKQNANIENLNKQDVTKEQPDLTQLKFCTELYPDGPTIKAGALKDTLWWHDARFRLNLTVRFINGTEFQKNKVMQHAKEWSQASAKGRGNDRKIRLRFIPYDGTSSGNTAHIRIIFQPGGSRSYVGIGANSVPQDQPTMFFGWVDEHQPEAVLRAVILHEFGHALGLIHEHQSPVANIPWDKEKVYQYYHATQNPPWTRDEVDRYIFARYSEDSTSHTAYDPTSIMHYAIPEELTVGDFSTPWNSVLSPSDLSLIKSIYKYFPCEVNIDCCFDKRTGKEIMCP